MTVRPGAIVVVGAGQAGVQLSVSLRAAGDARRIVLIGDEPVLPYQRPPLSKDYLEEKTSRSGLTLRPENFYSDQRIEIRLGMRVIGISRSERCIHLNSGEALDYEHLILATGSRNRTLAVPGSELSGVHLLRGVEDADCLARTLQHARKVVVIGGGFIGLELAALAARRGLEVTVVEAAERLLARSVSIETSKYIESFHVASGIRFLFSSTVRSMVGEGGQARLVEMADGRTIAADMVLVGVGAIPNTELATACGLVADNGIVVDEYLATSDPAIHAIGDCAAFPSPFAEGRLIRIESVQNAVDQAKCVANKLAGNIIAYTVNRR